MTIFAALNRAEASLLNSLSANPSSTLRLCCDRDAVAISGLSSSSSIVQNGFDLGQERIGCKSNENWESSTDWEPVVKAPKVLAPVALSSWAWALVAVMT